MTAATAFVVATEERMSTKRVHIHPENGICGDVDLVSELVKTRLYPGGVLVEHLLCDGCGEFVPEQETVHWSEAALVPDGAKPFKACTCGGVRYRDAGAKRCTGCGYDGEGGAQ